jgi:hypothetical protein
MVRAAILGLLLPASADPKRDREIFLKLLTMDPEGLWRRKTKAIPLAELFARCARTSVPTGSTGRPEAEIFAPARARRQGQPAAPRLRAHGL